MTDHPFVVGDIIYPNWDDNYEIEFRVTAADIQEGQPVILVVSNASGMPVGSWFTAKFFKKNPKTELEGDDWI